MAVCALTGTIQNASGTAVANVVVRLTPAPASFAAAAIGGIGVILAPVEVLTGSAGTFSLNAVQGFAYLLEIPAIGYREQFTCPATATVRFDLLGLRPDIEQARDVTDSEGAVTVELSMAVDRVDSVRERFTVIAVERSTTGQTGTYLQIGTVTLESGTAIYAYTDATGLGTYYYRARYRNAAATDAGPYSDPRKGDSADEALLLTVGEFKSTYLFGVDLTGDDGTPYPSRMFEDYIRASVAWLSRELDIPLLAENIVDETHDHYAQDYGNWGYFQLYRYPVLRVDGIQFQYPSMSTAVEIDEDWIVIEDGGVRGVVQIVPGQGNLADVLLMPGALLPLWSGYQGRVPGTWKISYRAGFEPGTLPADIKHVLAMHAAIGILNVAGDLIAGAGIANFSVSIPGLSQSVGTTSSATNAGYGARIIEYQKEIKEALPILKGYYGKTVRMVVA